MSGKAPSLKRPLIIKPLIFQLVTLLVSCTFFLALALRMDSGGLYTDETITPVIAHAIIRRSNGTLAVRLTPELTKIREKSPDLWFVAEDDSGRPHPEAAASLGEPWARDTTDAGCYGRRSHGQLAPMPPRRAGNAAPQAAYSGFRSNRPLDDEIISGAGHSRC